MKFDSCCIGTEVEGYDEWTVTHKDGTTSSGTRIERKGGLVGTVSQSRCRLLEAEGLSKRVPIEYLLENREYT